VFAERLSPRLHRPPPITSTTTTPTWGGARVDLGYLVTFLIPNDHEERSA